MLRATPLLAFILGSTALAPAVAGAQQSPVTAMTPGVCLFSRTAAMGGSRAGQSGTQRMQQIVSQVNAELDPQQQSILQENNALKTAQSSLSAAQYQQRAAAVTTRAQTFLQLKQLRNAQIGRTKALAEQAIGQVMDPLLEAVLAEHHCSVVFDRSTAYRWNGAMDLTDQVRAGLDQRMPTIQLNLASPESVQGRP